mgnify:CR=1 FL=1
MSQLLVPVYRGEVELIKPTDNGYLEFAREKFPSATEWQLKDPTENGTVFCLPEYEIFLLNVKLKDGYTIVGTFKDWWVVTKRENTIP